MSRKPPRILADPRDIGLFVVIAVLLGALTGTPTATYSIVSDRPIPSGVSLTLFLIFGLSPLIATVVLVRRLDVDGGIRPFLRDRFRRRTDARWYLIAVGLMPALFTVTYLGFIAFNEPVPIDLSLLGLLLLEVLLVGFVYNLVENYGWRGFLQEALQSHVSAITATLVVGVVWGLWHASLFLPGGQFEGFPLLAFFVVIVGEAVIIGWLYNSTNGSVLHAALMHTSFNASFGGFIILMVLADMTVDTFYWLAALVIWLTVATIIALTNPSTLRLSTSSDLRN